MTKKQLLWERDYSVKYSTFFAVVLFLCTVSSRDVFGAFEDKPAHARLMGMESAWAASVDDISSVYSNPAGLGHINQTVLSSFYSELFSIDELGYGSISCAVPVSGLGVFGLSYDEFGPSVYREKQVIVSQGFFLGNKMLFGYNMRLMKLDISEYGSSSAQGVDVGVQSNVTESIDLGFMLKNANKPDIGGILPRSFNLAISVNPLENIGISLGFDMSRDTQTKMCTGSEVFVNKYLILRAGMQTEPVRFSAGFSLSFRQFRLDYALSNHSELDTTSSFSLQLFMSQSTSTID